jgi:hypothetical protein
VRFNFYRIENQLRADDLLVRQKAGASFGQAAAALEKLTQQFQRTCIPVPLREHPFPSADVMDRLNALRRTRQRVMDQATFLQGLSAPAQDKIWRRLRDEESVLQSLLQADVAMLRLAAEVLNQAQSITCEAWKSAEGGAALEAVLDRWDATLRTRQDLLQIQGYR